MNDRADNTKDRETGDDGDTGNGGESLSAWQVITSTLAAAFGVQSSRNRQRDFSRGRASHFIAAGILFTVGFVLVIVLVVNLVLSGTG